MTSRFVMKRSVWLLVLLCFVLCGCPEPSENDEENTERAGKIILTSETPFDGTIEQFNIYRFIAPSEGREYSVIASFSHADGVPLNDRFTVQYDASTPDNMVDVTRTKLNTYQSRYVIKVNPNTTRKTYECTIEIMDETRVGKDGKPLKSLAILVITQAQ